MAGQLTMPESAKKSQSEIRRERMAADLNRKVAERPVTDKGGVAGGSYNDLRTVHRTAKNPGDEIAKEKIAKETPATTPKPAQPKRPQSTQGTARTYQKHVLFAVVSAFLIKLVSSGKFVPKS